MAAGAQARPALPLAAESAGPFARPVGNRAGIFLHLPFPPSLTAFRAPAAAARSTCSTICSASPRTPASRSAPSGRPPARRAPGTWRRANRASAPARSARSAGKHGSGVLQRGAERHAVCHPRGVSGDAGDDRCVPRREQGTERPPPLMQEPAQEGGAGTAARAVQQRGRREGVPAGQPAAGAAGVVRRDRAPAQGGGWQGPAAGAAGAAAGAGGWVGGRARVIAARACCCGAHVPRHAVVLMLQHVT
jgi:hypothetical protein